MPARRIDPNTLAAIKQSGKAKVIQKPKPKEKPKEQVVQSPGVDPKKMTEIFLRAVEHLASVLKDRPVEVPEIKIPEQPAAAKVKKIMIKNVERNTQNRIESVEMDVLYED
jgi:hypothetical protein